MGFVTSEPNYSPIGIQLTYGSYTLLLPKDLQPYLAVRTLNGKAVMDQLTLGSSPLPRPFPSLASRDEL